jgi:glutamate racemase
MACFRTIVVGLLSLNLFPAAAHRLGDDEDGAPVLHDDAVGGDNAVVNFDADDDRPKDAPPRLQHLTKDKHGKDLMAEFWKKAKDGGKPKIVFADSGVGGLSIMSKFINNFMERPLFKQANLIFFDTAGLNKDAHSRVVKKLLSQIDELNPDLLFIACNGMSAVYLESDNARDPKFPVIQMLPFAVEMWGKRLENSEGSAIIQFVSKFTGSTYVHLLKQHSSIIQNGIDKDRLVVQRCQDAITAIQDQGPDSKTAKKEIDKCAKHAVSKLEKRKYKNGKKLFLGMGCTHFGWADKHWKSSVEGANVQDVEVLDPNKKMAQYLFDEAPADLADQDSNREGGIEIAVILRRDYKMNKIRNLVVKPLQDAIDAALVKKSA